MGDILFTRQSELYFGLHSEAKKKKQQPTNLIAQDTVQGLTGKISGYKNQAFGVY